jgi:hypothetical protein
VGPTARPNHETLLGRIAAFMLFIAFAMFVILAVAGLVTAFVAFPHRGMAIPHAGWLSDAMVKVSDKLRP